MKYLPSSLYYKQFHIIFKILFFLYFVKLYKCDDIVYPSDYTFDFRFYQTIELINDDVLFISNDGIHVFSGNFSIDDSTKRKIYTHLLESDYASKVILSKFDDGHIISIINKYLYFFSPDGYRLADVSLDTDIDNNNANSYSLTAFDIIENYYYYYITYVNADNCLNLYYFRINNNGTSTYKKIYENTYCPKSNGASSTYIKEKGHSCELMFNFNEKILTCFFVIANPLSISHASFNISSDGINVIDNEINFFDVDSKYGSVKSCSVKDNPNKALICYCASKEYLKCLKYDLIQNSFEDVGGSSSNCDTSYLGITIKYYDEKKEFLVSHLVNSNGYFKLLKYSSKFFITYNATNIITNSDKTYYVSLVSFLFLSPYENYSLITYSDSYKTERFFHPAPIYEEEEIEEEYEEKNEEIEEEEKEEQEIKEEICDKGDYPFYYENTITCYNENNKLENLYFNSLNKTYNLCYEKCKTCNTSGDFNMHNCTSCINDHQFLNDSKYPNNCYEKCYYYYYYCYYYSIYEQYRCTDDGQCPEVAPFLIRNNNKCISNCTQDNKHQYNSECLDDCPSYTKLNKENICEDTNVEDCTSSVFEFNINLETISIDNLELYAKNYAEEFSYTDNHVSEYLSSSKNNYSFILYKNKECIQQLNLTFSVIDFGECYNKIQKYYNITQKLVIFILKTNIIQNSKPVTFYQFYSPITGKKLDIKNICDDEAITIYENILSNVNLSSTLLSLTLEQSINIFDLDDPFYTDLCYHFKGINGKDVPLKSRILSFFPNITLCDDDCTMKGVNISTMTAICNCKVNSLTDNYLLNNELVMSSDVISNAVDLINENNLAVLKCYKDVFIYQYFKVNTGSFIMIAFLIINTVCIIIFFIIDLKNIKKYIYNTTDEYFVYLDKNNKKRNSIYSAKNPPKKNIQNKQINNIDDMKQISGSTSTKLNLNKKGTSSIEIGRKDHKTHTKNKSKIDINKIENNKDNKNKLKNKSKSKTEINKIGINKDNQKNKDEINRLQKHNRTNKTHKTNKTNKINKKNKNKNRNEKLINNKKNIGHNNSSTLKLTINFDDYLSEFDESNYNQSVINDKRNFLETFVDSIKGDHLCVNTFIQDNIRPITMKIVHLLFYMALYFFVSGLFYDESLITDIYNSDSNGFFDFLNDSFGRLLSVSIIAAVLDCFVSFCFEDEDKIKEILMEKKKDIKPKINQFVVTVNRKYIIFISITTILTLFIWFYVSCFNNVYPNTKYNWIKASVFFFIVIQLSSLVKILVQTLFRYISLKYKSKKIFELSKILN